MDKSIRVLIACGLSVGLSFVWQALMPTTLSMLVTFGTGIALGYLATRRGAPNVLPTYRVEVRPDDYELEQRPPMNFLGDYQPTPRWDEPEIKHLRGVAWYDAEIPPKRHECWAQTDGWIGFDQTQRCACGALRARRFGGVWMERNSRKPKVAA